VTEDQEPYRWVIPGILEHQDRCVITAGEGVGKSVLSRQLALATAAGRHPFLPRYHIPPKRTLMVDLENPPSLIRRNLHHQVGRLTAHGVQDEGRAWIWREPDGIDVRTTLGYRKLERVMEQTQPDLVCIGPVYKMSLAHGDKYRRYSRPWTGCGTSTGARSSWSTTAPRGWPERTARVTPSARRSGCAGPSSAWP
jgi:RecA-family ATPase